MYIEMLVIVSAAASLLSAFLNYSGGYHNAEMPVSYQDNG
jgi:hypothetical protein